MPGVGVFLFGDGFRGALSDYFSSFVAAFRAEVYDPVGGFDYFHVVFDYDDGVAAVGESVQDLQEFVDVYGVEARGGFVQDVECASGLAF